MKNVIAVVWREDHTLETALKSQTEIIFHLAPNINTLQAVTRAVKQAGKKFYIHIDRAEGLGKDKAGLQYAKKMGVDGIISTRANLIHMAKEMGFLTVQRFFVMDTHSVETIMEVIRDAKADMVEVMPGVVPRLIVKIKNSISTPIIAGGLIESEEDMKIAFDSGATMISAGNPKLWN